MKGNFIVIEGIDGCGKTTQIEAIYNWLPLSGLMEKNSKLSICELDCALTSNNFNSNVLQMLTHEFSEWIILLCWR